MPPEKLPPFTLRDFSSGRYGKDQVSSYLIPKNSVANSLNLNFDEIVGSAKVRPGTVKLGATVASNKTPLGLGSFVGPGGSPDLLLAVFSGASTATLYYYTNSVGPWTASNLTALSNTKKNRFAVLGGSAFVTNATDGMKDSTNGSTWGTTNSIGTYKPSLVFRYKARLLTGGDPTLPSRIWFSSIVAPGSSPFITWDTNITTGDWVDINPDDGGSLTGFSESSTFCLVFKDTGMYRIDTVSLSVDAENIFNVGAVNQESIVLCQGVTYYFSGLDIRRTNGGYPEQISRPVQDFVNAIPRDNWEAVCGGTDGLNVYFAIGDVTVNRRDYTNVVLKFSTRDQNWSIHSYSNEFKFFSPFITTVEV